MTRTVLVTGATGRVGGQVAAQFTGSDVRVRALARNPAAAATQLDTSVEIVSGDLAAPSTVAGALDGVDAVFLVFPSVVADAAARELVATLATHVRRIVYLSAHGVPDPPGEQTPDGTIMGSHAHLEGLIAAATDEYSFLRASGFAANTLGWAQQIRHSDVLRWFLPEATRALVHEADLAAVAVRAFTENGHERMAYHLTGPEQLTQAEQLDAIGAALGRTLRFDEVRVEDAGAELFPDLPADVVRSIVNGHARMVKDPEPVSDTVERLIGRPATTFTQWARDHAADFARRDG